jgi:hypothetical protein
METPYPSYVPCPSQSIHSAYNECRLSMKLSIRISNILSNNSRRWIGQYPTWIFGYNLHNKESIVLPRDIDSILPYIKRDMEYASLTLTDNMIERIKEEISNINKDLSHCPKYKMNIGNVISYGKYRAPLSSVQMANLTHMHHKYGSGNIYKDILISYMKYNIFCNRSLHLSIPPHVIEYMEPKLQMFGSPFNVISNIPFLSAFPETDRCFGSVGKFTEDFKPTESGVYSCNPPYDEHTMEIMANTIVRNLDKISNLKLTYVIVIPKWSDFKGYEILRDSKWITSCVSFDKYEKTYYNYYQDKYHEVVPSYIIVMSNDKDNEITAKHIYNIW